MIVDFLRLTGDAQEVVGSILFDRKLNLVRVIGDNQHVLDIATQPLRCYNEDTGKIVMVSPKSNPQKFVSELPKVYHGTYFYAVQRGDSEDIAASLDVPLELGDSEGHPFRGNQYAPGSPQARAAEMREIQAKRQESSIRLQHDAVNKVMQLPVTDDVSKSGYIRPDGQIADLGDGGTAIAADKAAKKLLYNESRMAESSGMVRVHRTNTSGFNSIDIAKAPSPEQWETIAKVIKNVQADRPNEPVSVSVRVNQKIAMFKYKQGTDFDDFRHEVMKTYVKKPIIEGAKWPKSLRPTELETPH